MGRPSLAGERTEQILDAFERCVARFGLEGSSLDRIAEEADMKRSILRHYIGNRDELVLALADRVIAKYEAHFESHLQATSAFTPVKQLMSYLFPAKAVSSTESILVIESLIAAGATCPDIRKKMMGYIDRLIDRSASLLRRAYPETSNQKCWAAAYGVVSICFNQESLTPLGPPPKYLRAAKSSAEVLITSLER